MLEAEKMLERAVEIRLVVPTYRYTYRLLGERWAILSGQEVLVRYAPSQLEGKILIPNIQLEQKLL